MIPIPGKFYRLKNGMKYRCYANDGGETYPYHGACFDSGWTPISHEKKGIHFNRYFNIINEWVDMPEFDWTVLSIWRKWIAMDPNGVWYAYCQKPFQRENLFWTTKYDNNYETNNDPEIIPKKYSPKWEGLSKDSLICRPGTKGE